MARFGRSDLPMARDSVGRFLPWIVSFMVYLSILAVAGALAVSSVAKRWDRGLAGTLTVQLPPVEDAAEEERRLAAVLELLRAQPGVERAEPLPPERVAALLAPWLGGGTALEGLPIPRLIDVEVDPAARIDGASLGSRLEAAVAGASLDDHRVWLERLIELLHAAQATAIGVVALLGLATVGTVVFTTRTGLAIHRDVIEVLHLIGAQDGYIARQFARRALTLGLEGGLIGLGLAVPTLWGLAALASRLDAALIPEVTLAAADWAVLGAMPLLAGVIAHGTARLTVMRTLAGML